MAALPHDYEEILFAKDTFHIFTHWHNFTTGQDGWTSLAVDAGTSVAVNDAVGGRVTLTTGATDNNEADVRTTTEIFLVADNTPLRFECRAQYTEANTDDANVMHGFMSALAANSLVDDGAGVRTTGNYFVFFKIDGGTTWQVRSRNGTETETNDTGITAGGANYQKFKIEIDNQGSGTSVEVKFYIDAGGGLGWQRCRDATTLVPITHTILVASSTEMNAGHYVKAGGANSEVLLVDYTDAAQTL